MKKLVLFFTRNMSLKDWVDTGLFDREKLIYEKYLTDGVFDQIFWVTFGSGDQAIASKLKQNNRLHSKITILSKPALFKGKLGNILYSLLSPLIHYRALWSVKIIKTNQIDGSWSAVLAKWLTGKKLITRSGYLFSVVVKRRGVPKWKQFLFYWLEYIAYRAANHIIVTSDYSVRLVQKYFHADQKKISRVYNYVDTALFKPNVKPCLANRVVFVGRLSSEKNLINLIRAFEGKDWTLDIYGDGMLKEDLIKEIEQTKSKVSLKGVVPNSQLPELFKDYQYFVLPSFYEGMPKTLIEAMACGLVCLATKTTGNTELIDDGVNGYLINGTDAQFIRARFEEVIGKDHQLVRRKAVEFIEQKFSIEAVVRAEHDILRRFL